MHSSLDIPCSAVALCFLVCTIHIMFNVQCSQFKIHNIAIPFTFKISTFPYVYCFSTFIQFILFFSLCYSSFLACVPCWLNILVCPECMLHICASFDPQKMVLYTHGLCYRDLIFYYASQINMGSAGSPNAK